MKVGVIFYHKNITSIYQRGWIDECVNSIINQSYKDFVVYELNYGDDDFAIHKEYDINGEMHFFREKFSNHADAMNFLLDKAVTDGCDCVFNTNMDDKYHIDRFKIQIDYIKRGYDLISSNFIQIDANGADVRQMNFSKMDIYENLSKDHNIIAHPVVCYSRKFIEENRYMPEQIPKEDLLLWRRTCRRYKFHICDEHLLRYRLHGNQVSGVKVVTDTLNVQDLVEDKSTPDVDPNTVKWSGPFSVAKKSKKSNKVGLLIIATNKYTEFIQPLIDSADEFFLSGYDVTYFIFTNKELDVTSKRNIISIDTIHKDWPWMTLGRYKIFTRNSPMLMDMDYLYYCDVDMKFVSNVGDEIFGDLVATQHPGYYDRRGSPEQNEKSLAFIPSNLKTQYFAGGFNGGSVDEFLKMSRILSKNIDIDYSNGIVAIWHDESHLNKYFSMIITPSVILSPSYCYTENSNIPFEQKLIALNKDHDFFRDGKEEKKEEKEGSKITDFVININKQNINNNTCSCGEVKDKRSFNFCQKCHKLY